MEIQGLQVRFPSLHAPAIEKFLQLTCTCTHQPAAIPGISHHFPDKANSTASALLVLDVPRPALQPTSSLTQIVREALYKTYGSANGVECGWTSSPDHQELSPGDTRTDDYYFHCLW
jgi:hypothetical protein